MPQDLFRLLGIRNRRAFSLAGREGKVYRTRLIDATQEIEAKLRNVLPSNYLSSIGGPNYTIALRAYAIEFARIKLALEDLEGDTYLQTDAYGNNRADILYQKFGSLLGVDRDLQLNIFDSQEFHDFLQALVSIFFGGSTPANIVRGIELFVGEEGIAQIHENFLDARDPNSAFDISDQFGFRVDFEVTETIAREFTDIGVKLDFLLDLVKPAHTLFVLRFIFTDLSDILQNADDSFLVDNIWDHDYDDMRRYCHGVAGRDRLGVNEVLLVTESITGMGGSIIELQYGPISKSTIPPELGGSSDVTVRINGVGATIVSVSAAEAVITIAETIVPTDTVTVTYYYWKNVDFQLTLNNPGQVLWDPHGSKFPVTYVLYDPQDHQPQQVEWSYGAFQRDYTAALNDPSTLVLNEPPHQISDPVTGRVYGHRHVLNWANYVESPDITNPDRGYRHLLNEGTPIVELKEAADTRFEWDGLLTPKWSGLWGSGHWGLGAWGGPYIAAHAQYLLWWDILQPGGHFIQPIDTETTETGEEGLISIACDGGLTEMSIDTPYEDQYEWPDIPYCDNDNLFIFNQSVVNGTDLLNNFEGVDGCQLRITVDTEVPFEDTSTVPSSATDDFYAIEGSAEESRGESYDLTGLFVMNESNVNGSDVLFDNLTLGHWTDEGYIYIDLGGVISHLDPYESALQAGPP